MSLAFSCIETFECNLILVCYLYQSYCIGDIRRTKTTRGRGQQLPTSRVTKGLGTIYDNYFTLNKPKVNIKTNPFFYDQKAPKL